MFWHDLLNQFYLVSECRVHSSCELKECCFAFGSGMEPKCLLPCSPDPPPTPVLSETNPAHIFLPHFFQIYFNIALLSLPSSSKYSLPIRFCDQNVICISHLFYVCYMPHPSHPQFFLIALITYAAEYCYEAPYRGIFSSLLILFPFRYKYSPQH
jgi:hypothetical protein